MYHCRANALMSLRMRRENLNMLIFHILEYIFLLGTAHTESGPIQQINCIDLTNILVNDFLGSCADKTSGRKIE